MSYDLVWKTLNEGHHVLLLIDSKGDDSYFDRKVEDIYQWFRPIIKIRHGAIDFLLVNGSYLCLRRFMILPVTQPASNIKVMTL